MNPEFWKDILTKPIDPSFWLQEHEFIFKYKIINLMALHGFLCLALRHPRTKDHYCRPVIVELVKQIGEVLVDLKALTPEQRSLIENTEGF